MDGLTGLVALLVAFHVVVFALAPLFVDHRRRTFRRRFHVPMRPLAITWTTALLACVLLAAVGDLPLEASMGRREVRAVGLVGMLLVGGTSVGCAAIVGGLLVGRRVYRLRTGEREPPGEIVATGRAVPTADGEAEPSPVFERPAVCWAWTLEANDRFGGDSGWTIARSGSGGVPFRVERGAEYSDVTVDPNSAYVDIPRPDSTIQPPDDPAPGRLERLADTDIGGTDHRYSEGTVASGDTVTVVGEVDAGGRVIDDGSLATHVTAGERAAVIRRLGRRALGYLAIGSVCLLVSIPRYLTWLQLR
ncbi:hypothetical protein ACFR99_08250 [Haloarchaeobius amylolyticus]|uniref:RING-type E3 ubiquitin transferase n=1 Tax=Haloarchaeobius amylolyticus TaxID=1198296 RepID=A0ABD6BET5_9EURY